MMENTLLCKIAGGKIWFVVNGTEFSKTWEEFCCWLNDNSVAHEEDKEAEIMKRIAYLEQCSEELRTENISLQNEIKNLLKNSSLTTLSDGGRRTSVSEQSKNCIKLENGLSDNLISLPNIDNKSCCAYVSQANSTCESTHSNEDSKEVFFPEVLTNGIISLPTNSNQIETTITKVSSPTSNKQLPIPASLPFFCQLCNITYPSSENISQHIQSVHKVKIPKKVEKVKVKSNFTDLMKVCKLVHNYNIQRARASMFSFKRSRRATTTRHMKCNECPKIFKSLYNLQNHVRAVHNYKVHKCVDCTKSFTCLRYLRAHIKKVHPIGEKEVSLSKCNVCDLIFTSRGLKSHIKRKHENAQGVLCEICSRTFTCLEGLKRHQRIHSGKKPYTCGECDKVFNTAYNLTGHIRTHTNEKPFVCDRCGVAFTHNVSLKNHKIKHCYR